MLWCGGESVGGTSGGRNNGTVGILTFFFLFVKYIYI